MLGKSQNIMGTPPNVYPTLQRYVFDTGTQKIRKKNVKFLHSCLILLDSLIYLKVFCSNGNGLKISSKNTASHLIDFQAPSGNS